jgi:DNA-binding response OmpR family regulator
VQPYPAIILYVETNNVLLKAVCDVLEFAGWYVRGCTDAGMGYALIESKQHFDILIIAHDRHGVAGLRMVQRARQLAHRQQTPIILTSLADHAAEAQAAGADAFLRKPNNLIELVGTIRRLLPTQENADAPTRA